MAHALQHVQQRWEAVEETAEQACQSGEVPLLLRGIRTRGASIHDAETVIFRPPGGVLSDMYYHFLFDGALMFFLCLCDGALMFFLWRRCTPGLDRPLIVWMPPSAPFVSHFFALFGNEAVHECEQEVVVNVSIPHQKCALNHQQFEQRREGCKGGQGPPLTRAQPPPNVIEVYFPKVGPSWGPFTKYYADALCAFRSHVLSQLEPCDLASLATLVCVFRRAWAPAGQIGNRGIIANEAEVWPVLTATAAKHALMYEELSLETLDIWSQIKAFARAHIVVAQHGSALANVVWMPPHSHVIELGLPLPQCAYKALCNVCDVNWMSCCSPGPSDGTLAVVASELESALARCA